MTWQHPDTGCTIVVTSTARRLERRQRWRRSLWRSDELLRHGVTISTRRSGFNKTHNHREVVSVDFSLVSVLASVFVSVYICCLLATLPTSYMGIFVVVICLANCCHPTGSDVFVFVVDRGRGQPCYCRVQPRLRASDCLYRSTLLSLHHLTPLLLQPFRSRPPS